MRQRDWLPQLGKNGDFGATSRQIRIAEDDTTQTKDAWRDRHSYQILKRATACAGWGPRSQFPCPGKIAIFGVAKYITLGEYIFRQILIAADNTNWTKDVWCDRYLPHSISELDRRDAFFKQRVPVPIFYRRFSVILLRTSGTENRSTTILRLLPNIENRHHPITSNIKLPNSRIFLGFSIVTKRILLIPGFSGCWPPWLWFLSVTVYRKIFNF